MLNIMSNYVNKLLAQSFLLTHTLNELYATHGVCFRQSTLDSRKFSLNYDMLEAKDADPVAAQCRGVVLYRIDDEPEFNGDSIVGETLLLCRTMPRFFNYGQSAAANVNFNKAKFFEKLDGTMIAFYYDTIAQAWCVATRSVPDADLALDGFGQWTFSKLFKHAISETSGMSYENWLLSENLKKRLTYIFELCTPVNQVVVPHTAYRAHSIAILNTNSGEQFDPSNPVHKLDHVPVCPSYSLDNVNDMLTFVASMNGHEHEGLVVCDDKFNRIKVKNAEYLALSRITDSACKSPRSMLEMCLSGKLDDALPLLNSHVQGKACEMKESLSKLFKAYDEGYLKLVVLASDLIKTNGWDAEKDYRKALAISANSTNLAPLSYVMARCMNNCNSMHEYVESRKNIDGSYAKSVLDALLQDMEQNDAD